MKFSDLQTKQQQQIIQSVANASQLDAQSVEKDWWVTQVLKAIFSLPTVIIIATTHFCKLIILFN